MRAAATREALEDLHRKYAEMLEMRLAHEAGDEDAPAVRVRMVALALRFPGALREIDDLALGEIRRRVAELEAVLGGKVEALPWMEALSMFHALTRGALCAKRWLAGRKRVDADLRRAYAAAIPSLSFPEDAGAWVVDLESIASPPRGRVTLLVLARLARELGTTPHGARLLVFGTADRGRRR